MPQPTQTLEFSYNWNNKLGNKAYTTIRLANPGKYQIGITYAVTLKKVFQHNATCIDIRQLTLNQVNEFIARLDTGYSAKECKDIIVKMYAATITPTTPLYLILLQRANDK